MWLAGIDGCRGGWVSFKVDLVSLGTSVELIDLPYILRNKPDDLATLAIDIPVGLLDRSRACDKAITHTPIPNEHEDALLERVREVCEPHGHRFRSKLANVVVGFKNPGRN
jgi:hypothetical protein